MITRHAANSPLVSGLRQNTAGPGSNITPGSKRKPEPEEMTMKSEMSPKTRSIVSGVAAVGITAVLVSTLVEALNPALLLSETQNAAPQTIAAASARRNDASTFEA
jgi:hypothetical protein